MEKGMFTRSAQPKIILIKGNDLVRVARLREKELK